LNIIYRQFLSLEETKHKFELGGYVWEIVGQKRA